MNYELIDDITSADIAIRVKAANLSLLFKYGAEALISETVENLSSIKKSVSREGILQGDDLSLLYYDFLNEFLFIRDSENILLTPSIIEVSLSEKIYTCQYLLTGEKIDPARHKFKTGIKAVTLHRLRIYKINRIFIAESVFDV